MVTLSHSFRQLNECQCTDLDLNVKYYLAPEPPPFSKKHLNAYAASEPNPPLTKILQISAQEG